MQAAPADEVPPAACDAARARARAPGSAAVARQRVGERGDNICTLRLSVGGQCSCLRLYEVQTDGQPTVYEDHVKRACAAFAAHGLAPGAYAGGSGWSLEPWLGPTLEESLGAAEDMETVGRLLAALHSDVAPAWFEDTARSALRDFPAVQSLAHLVSLAPHAAARLAQGVATGRRISDGPQIRMLADTSNSELLLQWASGETALAPVHAAARRIVTVHGDAHPRNLVRAALDDRRLVFIDLELACVTQAVHDLARVLHEVAAHGHATNEQARANEESLLRAYLRASGFAEPTRAELEQLVLDCRIAYFCGLYLCARNLPFAPAPAAAVVACVHDFAAQVRRDDALRRSVLNVPHCASFFADTLGAMVHDLGGRCKRAGPQPQPQAVGP